MVSALQLTDKHRRDQVRLAIIADSQARRLWDSTLDLNDLTGTQPVWKKTMVDLLTRWYQLSARMAARYLPQYREASIGQPGSEVTIAIPRFDKRQAAKEFDWMGATNIMWHLAKGQTEEAAWAAARSLFLGMFHEAVLAGGRRTIQEWAKKDPRAIGWRRVSDGDPCAFCAMLVSRGPVYLSEKTALKADTPSGKYHAHCGCTVEVVYGDWQPTEQEQQWIDDYYRAAERFPKGEKTWQNILPIMRDSGYFRDSPTINTATWPFDKAKPLTRTVRDHILYGDKKGKGGHLSGYGVAGKTEFPESWTPRTISEAIGQVLANPDWHVTAKDPRGLHGFGAIVDGVQVEVQAFLRDGLYEVDRAFPAGGAGVVRNTENGRIEAGLSKRKKWKTGGEQHG